ncbi:hypothetical protein EXIGLDRAFT_717959 [Exidia glandulosa HHB12029]|uniref:Uncharacterized protein n=1 Tax=Exidia glandulosa HHB12029 TaxID=1314781 RepID=A0A166BJ56_EXIGL|nr:hypothetical protein EXIGLDRAFT_717959 [Exidia glandulosa HHB12029]
MYLHIEYHSVLGQVLIVAVLTRRCYAHWEYSRAPEQLRAARRLCDRDWRPTDPVDPPYIGIRYPAGPLVPRLTIA